MGDKMKKGFTLIELLAVFTITGIIVLISIPKITSLLKKSDEQSYEIFLSNISIACEAYIEDSEIVISTNETKQITLKQLIESGFLKSTLKNPNNNATVSDDININKIVIASKDEDNILNCELQD
jgi:prepilin-type N-terminal cleavage/methylation domain-containing protein